MLKKVIVFYLLSLFVLSASVMALDFQTGKKVYVAKDQIIFDNFFAAGEKVHIAGRIMGDLIVFFWAFGTLVTTRFVTYKEARERGVL